LLYTIIALPNIIFAGLIGVLLDYFGIRKAFIIMAIGAILSQTVVAFGGVYKSYTALLIGRFLYGVF
jgi:MFS family permease